MGQTALLRTLCDGRTDRCAASFVVGNQPRPCQDSIPGATTLQALHPEKNGDELGGGQEAGDDGGPLVEGEQSPGPSAPVVDHEEDDVAELGEGDDVNAEEKAPRPLPLGANPMAGAAKLPTAKAMAKKSKRKGPLAERMLLVKSGAVELKDVIPLLLLEKLSKSKEARAHDANGSPSNSSDSGADRTPPPLQRL